MSCQVCSAGWVRNVAAAVLFAGQSVGQNVGDLAAAWHPSACTMVFAVMHGPLGLAVVGRL